jgi:hypothetical protein
MFLAVVTACAACAAPVSALAPQTKLSSAYQSGVYWQRLSQVELTGNYCTDLVNVALSQVGYHEGSDSAGYSGTEYYGWRNYTEFGSVCSLDASWCAMFVSWCARQAGIPRSVLNTASRAVVNSSAYSFHVPFYTKSSYSPKPGDLIFFQHPGYHVGVVVAANADRVVTVEGNASNAVRMNSYSPGDRTITGYGVYSGTAADGSALTYDGSQLLTVKVPSEAAFGKWPDGRTKYSCSSYCALMGRETAIPQNLYVRRGYTLKGYYLFRSDDGKWLTTDGWKTGYDLVSNSVSRQLITNGVNLVPDDTWRDGCENASEFALCAVWTDNATGKERTDVAAPFSGGIDDDGWYWTMADICPDDWFFNDVKFTLQKGIMSGITESRFYPGMPLTRAMLVDAFYKLAGSPAQDTENALPFTDVDAGAEYVPALRWAFASGIVQGVSADSFAPTGTVDRQTYITMLMRYAAATGGAQSVSGGFASAYPDAAKVAPWAADAVEWALENGMVNGISSGGVTYLRPAGTVTRAQAAAMLHRYSQTLAK